MGASIERHGESLVQVAKINADQQEKDRQQARANDIRARINSLRDTKRNLVICLCLAEVASNKSVSDTIAHEITLLEQEIQENIEELNGMINITTPQRSNRSPN